MYRNERLKKYIWFYEKEKNFKKIFFSTKETF